jgi:hypothetical protein
MLRALEVRLMKQLCLSIVFLVGLATVSGAQTMGTLTENGVSMDVKAAVAVLGEGPALTLYLLPFQPTPDETAKLQAGDTFWLLGKASPDPKKWKNGSPYGSFKLGWSLEKESVGDTKKVSVYVYSYNVGVEGSNLNVNKFGSDVPVTLTGPLKEGQEVAVTSKGSESFSKSTLAWDLKVKSKVLASTKKK